MYLIPSRPQRNWIDKLSPELAEIIRNEMCEISLEDGQGLFEKGDEPRGIYEVRKGRIKLCSFMPSGREMTLSIVEAPTTISDTVVTAGSPHMHTAIAMGESLIGLLKLNKFIELRQQYPEINEEMLKVTSRRLIWMFNFYEEHSILNLEARLASRLHSLTITTGLQDSAANNIYHLQLKQDELANMMGATRQTVNKILKEWETRGLVKLTYGKMIINSPERLLELVVETEADD